MNYIVLLVVSLFTSLSVYADTCDSKTKSNLLKEANQIKIDYEEKTENIHVKDDMYDYYTDATTLLISIYNLSNNFTLNISNDLDDSLIIANQSDISNGKYTFDDIDYYKIIKYKINVYSNTDCDRYLVKTITYTKPMFNLNSVYTVCDGNENIAYCQKYITNPKLVFSMGVGLKDAIDSYKKGDTVLPGEDEKENFFKKYYIYIIVGGVVCVLGVGTIWYINKKRSEI